MPIILILLLGAGLLLAHSKGTPTLDKGMPKDVVQAVTIAYQSETDPRKRKAFANVLKQAGFPKAAASLGG